ncbi:MAG: hypothetical protein LUP97_07225 [Methanoregula sp.]|nr:hypothetical protein [Methanoregula sp.]
MDNPPEREARIHWDKCEDPARNEDQLGKQYRETGIIPGIGAALGRPKKPITAEESGVIANAFERFSVWSEDVRGADLERRYRKYLS